MSILSAYVPRVTFYSVSAAEVEYARGSELRSTTVPRKPRPSLQIWEGVVACLPHVICGGVATITTPV